MPVFKSVLRYFDATSGMSWSHTNWREETTAADVFTAADTWNTAYMSICAPSVTLLDLRVYIAGGLRIVNVVPSSAFANSNGTGPGVATEISSYAQWRGFGGTGVAGSGAWKLHGIDGSFVTGSALDSGEEEVSDLIAAGISWFRCYRPEVSGTSALPVVDPPVAWDTAQIIGMFSRRVGRSFLSSGQQQRYTRTA